MKLITAILASIFAAGCSVVGQSDVETAPYQVVLSDKEQQIEVRNYDSMVLVSADMSSQGRFDAFRSLFDYISGNNESASEIAMTTPVMMNEKSVDASDQKEGREIAMTTPVFMDERAGKSVMSFVMPNDFTLASTPKPKNPGIWVSELRDYYVATIKFSGTLNDSNVEKNTKLLQKWIVDNHYSAVSSPVRASFNGPLTLPMMRHNEIQIEIKPAP